MDLALPVNKMPYNKIQNEIGTMLHIKQKLLWKKLHWGINESGEWVANVAVTVDGWHMIVLSVDNGEVLDYELISLVCNLRM